MIQVICFLFMLISKALGESKDSHDCNKRWPQLDLFLPYRLHTNHRDQKYYEFETLFLRTFMMFFPLKASNVTLNVAIDEEMNTTSQAAELIATINGFKHQVPGGVKLSHIPTSQYYRKGYDRQQLAMFWADNFTTSEYVGFADTDASFLTYIDREDLFEDGKPVVNAKSGYRPVSKTEWRWTYTSYTSLGILEPFRCMSYFPVIVKTSHLPDLRDYVAKYHNMSFNEAFYHNMSNYFDKYAYSQFHIMCTYLFKFKRDEYKWYVHSETPNWDGINPPPIFGQDGNLSQITPEMRLPKPRIATHGGHRNFRHKAPIPDIRDRLQMNLFLQNGVCMSPPFPRTEDVCNSENRSVIQHGYYYEMHNFENVDYTFFNDPEVFKNEYQKRLKRFEKCTHEWDPAEMKIIMRPRINQTGHGWR